ncbi:MAG: HD domain-containing phosphohydrolase [Elusimicrobiota bacterium]
MEKKEQNTLIKLFEIAKSLSSALDIDLLLKRIGDAAETLTVSEASSIMLLDENKQNLYFKVTTGEKSGVLKKLKVAVGQGIAGSVAQKKESLIVNDVTKDVRFNSSFDKSSGFTTKSILAVPILSGDELIGVVEVLNKKNNQQYSEGDKEILESLASFASVSILNAMYVEDQKNFFIYIIEIIVQGIEGHDPKLTGHTWRVAQMSTALAQALGLNDSDYKNLYYGALLHDIGYLSSAINAAADTSDIFTSFTQSPEKIHPTLGWEMVRKINILKGSAPVVLYHHEHYDGTGYPQGLKNGEIPLGAQIVSIAEFTDEMKIAGYPPDKIQEMIKENSSKKFDPNLVDIFLKEIDLSETVLAKKS